MTALALERLERFTTLVRPPERVGALARRALVLEVLTFPKPGLVSHVDDGSHADMTAATLLTSAEALEPFFTELARAGARGEPMTTLRAIGVAAEAAMLRATAGVNAHRGAVFALGLLCAAAGVNADGPRRLPTSALGRTVRRRWGAAIARGPVPLHSHGAGALRRHGAGGARAEAAAGFPSAYRTGLPALRRGRALRPGDEEAARVEACFALIAGVEDTNLLHRGGAGGLAHARRAARGFLDRGGVGRDDWRAVAGRVHDDFVARRLSPGGSADLLAATLFIDASEVP